MKCLCLILTMLMGITSGIAQQKTTPPPNQKAGVQDIVRVVPELLPQAVRDSISTHPIDGKAEVTSADQMSKDGNLIYKVNFLKDDNTWSKTYDVNGRHIDRDRIKESDPDIRIYYK